MDERMIRYYDKEEEFLEEFDGAAFAAAGILNGEWLPRFYANDESRRSSGYFLSTGQLSHLIFDSAVVFHNNNCFSSVQIVLKSSQRIINVWVRRIDGKYVAEKLVDKSNI